MKKTAKMIEYTSGGMFEVETIEKVSNGDEEEDIVDTKIVDTDTEKEISNSNKNNQNKKNFFHNSHAFISLIGANFKRLNKKASLILFTLKIYIIFFSY